MSGIQPKIALVTGASAGLGKEIAIGLAKAGLHVIIVCRDKTRGKASLEEIKNKSMSKTVDLLVADLSSQDEIINLVATIEQTYPCLHILINNAAVVLPKKKLSVDEIEMTLATNYLGPFLLTNLLIDLLKKSAPARVINISSAIHQWAKLNLADLQYTERNYQCLKAYAQSKLLLNIYSFELAKRLKPYNITTNCIHPGAVKTQLGRNHGDTSFLLRSIDTLIKCLFLTPAYAAKKVLDLALSNEVEGLTGEYWVKNKSMLMNYDDFLSQTVWKISEQMIKNSFT